MRHLRKGFTFFGLLMRTWSRLILTFACAASVALAANHILYDGGVRAGADDTVTAGTYAPQIGGKFAVGSLGTILQDGGGGWGLDSIAPEAANQQPVYRNVPLYGSSAPLWGRQWAVGEKATILMNSGGVWNVASIAANYADARKQTAPMPLFGSAFGLSAPSTWAVGANGTIFRDSGDGFTPVAAGAFAPTIAPLSLYAPSAGTPLRAGTIAVTATGSVFRTVGTWAKLASAPAWLSAGATLSLNAFSFRDSTGIAVGDAGVMLRFDMATLTWNQSYWQGSPYFNAANAPSLKGVVVYGRERVVAVGTGGVVVESFPGAAWATRTLGSSPSCSLKAATFSGLFGSSPYGPALTTTPTSEETWVVGCGAVYRRVATRTASQTLSAVVTAAPFTALLQAGAGGVPAGVEFTAIAAYRAAPSAGVVVVGTGSTIYHFFAGTWEAIPFNVAGAPTVVFTSILVSSAGIVTVAGATTASLAVSTVALPEVVTASQTTFKAWGTGWTAVPVPATVPASTTFTGLSGATTFVGNGAVVVRRASSGTTSLDRPAGAVVATDNFIGIVDETSCVSQVLTERPLSSSAGVGANQYPSLVFSYNLYSSPFLKMYCHGYPRLDTRAYSHLEFRIKYASTTKVAPTNDLTVTYVRLLLLLLWADLVRVPSSS